MTFAQGEVETGIHAWASKKIIEQIQSHIARIIHSKGTGTNNDVSLMGRERFFVVRVEDGGFFPRFALKASFRAERRIEH